MSFIKCKRRHILLLEVLIAFAIIALCIFPLIYPHAAIAKSQRSLIKKIELDHAISHLFAQVYQDLYTNKISWSDIEKSKKFVITPQELKKFNNDQSLPFTGTYQFEPYMQKPKSNQANSPQETSAHIFNLVFALYPENEKEQKKALTYQYHLFIFHDLKTDKSQNGTESNENKS